MSEPSLAVITERLGGSALAASVIAGTTPASWLDPAPGSVPAWDARAREVASEFAGRDWLSPLQAAFGPAGGAAAERLARAGRGGIVVTTGQQPGLFGGPGYTWWKALTALALADAIEAATGVPTAPVFWAATDDTDFEEACWTAFAFPGGAERVQAGTAPAPGTPMSWAPLGDVTTALEALRRASGSAADPRPLDAAAAAYGADATVGGAYLALLRAMLEPLGIAVMDASHPDVRAASHAFTSAALRGAAAIEVALASRARAIRAEGLEPQVADVPGLSLVFEYAGRTRQRVPVARGASLADEAAPGALGPNVLLRPIVERAIVPTVAYVGGPAELAYFAQSAAVADALELARPLGVPRWSGSVIEPHVARLLAKHGLGVEDVRVPDLAERRLAERATPPAAAEALAVARRDLDARLEEVRLAAGTLLGDATIAGTGRAIGYRLDRLERRLRAAVKRRETTLMHELGTMRGALLPLGVRQERALNFLPLLARHGDALLGALRSATRAHADALVAATSERRSRATSADGA